MRGAWADGGSGRVKRGWRDSKSRESEDLQGREAEGRMGDGGGLQEEMREIWHRGMRRRDCDEANLDGAGLLSWKRWVSVFV